MNIVKTVERKVSSAVDTYYLRAIGRTASDIVPGTFPPEGVKTRALIHGKVQGSQDTEGLIIDTWRDLPKQQGREHTWVQVNSGEFETPYVEAHRHVYTEGADVIESHFPPVSGEDILSAREICRLLDTVQKAQLINQPITA